MRIITLKSVIFTALVFAATALGLAPGCEDIVEENNQLRQQVIWLHNEIARNISQLQELVAEASEKVEEHESEIMTMGSSVDQLENTQNDLSGKLDAQESEIDILETRIDSVDDDFATFQNELENLKPPLGSILPWVNRPSSEILDNMMEVPEGWVPCNGSIIPEPSIWAGQLTPDLTGRFLKGEAEEEMLTMEEDTTRLHDHTHLDGGHSHSAEATTWTDPHSHSYKDYYRNNDAKWGDNANNRPIRDIVSQSRTTENANVTAYTTVEIGHDVSGVGLVENMENFDIETKPRNMAVVYIMRCW